ncbi:MAG: CoA transferase [Actinomycetota bacterium]
MSNQTADGAPGSGGPLTGVRVIDLSSVLMGPSATRALGDLGADVIAVEPKAGDRNRGMGPGPSDEFSGISLNLLRNKRSIAIDLKQQAGREAFLAIAATADVMVTNLRPGPVGRLGLDDAAVRAVRPDIIYCRAHGYPSDSEDADAPAYDDIIQSTSGFADLFALMGLEPMLFPMLVADKVCGMAITNAVLAALYHRAVTGEGQLVEIPMVEVMRAFVLTEHGSGAIPEPPVADAGYPRILTPARRPQPTADGWINILPYDEMHYERLFRAGGRPDLIGDERYASRRARTTNSDSLYRDIAAILPQRTTAAWLAFCQEHDIPATETATIADLVDSLPMEEHPAVGSYRYIPPGERFSKSPGGLRRPAPRIGEHGVAILGEAGFTASEIEELINNGVLHQPADDIPTASE